MYHSIQVSKLDFYDLFYCVLSVCIPGSQLLEHTWKLIHHKTCFTVLLNDSNVLNTFTVLFFFKYVEFRVASPSEGSVYLTIYWIRVPRECLWSRKFADMK